MEGSKLRVGARRGTRRGFERRAQDVVLSLLKVATDRCGA